MYSFVEVVSVYTYDLNDIQPKWQDVLVENKWNLLSCFYVMLEFYEDFCACSKIYVKAFAHARKYMWRLAHARKYMWNIPANDNNNSNNNGNNFGQNSV